MGGCSEENVAPAWCRVGQRAPDGAGRAVNPPGSGPAAGGCAFGRLRGMPRKQAPHPWGLGRGIHAADGPAPPGPAAFPSPARGGLALGSKSRSSADQRSAPTKAQNTTAAARRFRSHEPPLPPLSGPPAGHRQGVGEGLRRTVGAMDGAIEPHGRVYGVSCAAPLPLQTDSNDAPTTTPDEPSQQDDPPPVGYDARPRSGRCTQ